MAESSYPQLRPLNAATARQPKSISPVLHWIRPPSVAFAGAVDGIAVPSAPHLAETPIRAFHARMLAHAATRRRAAAASLRNNCRIDALYWKSCAPRALDKARACRQGGFPALP
jgi:hypothetical protein